MKNAVAIALLGMLTVMAACTDPEHYPISDQNDTPGDPVHEMDEEEFILPMG